MTDKRNEKSKDKNKEKILLLREEKTEKEKQIKKHEEEITNLIDMIGKARLENKHYQEKLGYLQNEKGLKELEERSKSEVFKKEANKNNYMSVKNNQSASNEEAVSSIDKKNVKRLVEVFEKPGYSIVESLREDYSKMTKEMEKIFEKEKSSRGDDQITLYVILDDEQEGLPFKILDDYYCYIDLLKESCRFYNLSPNNYALADPEGNTINLILSVKSHAAVLRGNRKIIPRISLVSTSQDIEIQINDTENNRRKEEDAINANETAQLIAGIENIEDELLEKLKKIIFYLVFLSVLFVSVMNRQKIQERFYITDAFKSQMMEISYFKDNRQKLENRFSTIENLNELNSWFLDAYFWIFNFKDMYYYENSSTNTTALEEKNVTTVMESYYIIGNIRILLLRHDMNSNSNSNSNSSYEYSYSFDKSKDVYKNYDQIRKPHPLDYPLNFKGTLATYSATEAYFTLIQPTSRDSYILYSLIRNINLFDQDMQLFLIQFNCFNNNDNFLISISLGVEQHKVGYISHAFQICVLTFLEEMRLLSQFNITLELVFVLFYYILLICYSFYSWFDFIYEIKRDGIKFFLQFWNFIRFFKVNLYIISVVMRVILYTSFGTKFQDMTNNSEYYDTIGICNLDEILCVIEMIMICLTLIFFLQYLDKNIVGPIFETLFSSLPNILRYIISYIFTVVGYSIFCNYVYGMNIISFSTIDSSLVQLFLIIFGDFSVLQSMTETFPEITQPFLLAFSLTFFMLYTNWLIATIMHGYDVFKAQEKRKKLTTGVNMIGLLENLDLFKEKYKRSISMFVKDIIQKIKFSKKKKQVNDEKEENKNGKNSNSKDKETDKLKEEASKEPDDKEKDKKENENENNPNENKSNEVNGDNLPEK